MNVIDKLGHAFGRPGAIRFSQSPLGGPIATLCEEAGEVDIALKGGQVLAWRRGGEDLLWLSPMARLDDRKPVRGGIPVCWPWFGPHPKDAKRPAHGFARTADWQPVSSSATAGEASLTLVLSPAPEHERLWPHKASATLTVKLSGGLSVELRTRNEGQEPIEITQALHTYFRVGEIARCAIDGLGGHDYIDKLDGNREKPQIGRIIIDRELDRIYLGPAPLVTLHDTSHGRSIEVRSRGSRSTVVWNPWIDKAARLGDLGPDGWRRMLCIETANAGPDLRTLEPGSEASIGVTYSVVPIRS